MLRAVFLACIICFSAGCYSLKVDRQVVGLDRVELSQHFFCFGLLGDKEINLTEQCPRGFASFTEKFTFEDILLTVLTAGIYSPRTVYVQCAS